MQIDDLKIKDFKLLELANGFVLFSKDHEQGEYHNTDEKLLAAILDLEIPRLEDQVKT